MAQRDREELFRAWLYAGVCVSITGIILLLIDRSWLRVVAYPDPRHSGPDIATGVIWFLLVAIVAIELAGALGYALAKTEGAHCGFIGAHLALASWWAVVLTAGPGPIAALVIAPAVCIGGPLVLGLAWALFPRGREFA